MDKRSNPIDRGCISYGGRPRLFSPPGVGEKRVTKEVLCRADPDLWEARQATAGLTRPFIITTPVVCGNTRHC
jgi:hypothetical protein